MQIAIIGGGLSGALTVLQLLRQARTPLQLHLVEPGPAPGCGVAYGTAFAEHLLNVPAINMGLFPDAPAHFHQWLQTHHPGAYQPTDFVPRQVYGQYIRQHLDAALAHTPPGCTVTLHPHRAVAGRPAADGIRIRLDDGTEIAARRAVLALGNFTPTDPVPVRPEWAEANRYIRNPWTARAYENMETLQDLVLIGSGLTALDVVAAACKRGFQGRFHLVSSHGRLPLAYTFTSRTHTLAWRIDQVPSPLTVHELLGLFRQELRRSGHDWQAVIQAFRPWVPALWQRLPVPEKKLFLRRAASLWNVHRHRVAEHMIRMVGLLRQMNRLHTHKGRVTGLGSRAGRMQVRLADGPDRHLIYADRVVNCTGPCSDLERIARTEPFVDSLLAGGHARPDPLRMGFDALPTGCLLDAQGRPSKSLFTLGPPLKGILFECTAVPEIREQAARLAAELLT